MVAVQPPVVLTDDDIRQRLTPDLAVRWMREALLAHDRGQLTAPPRASTDLEVGRLVFTACRYDGDLAGFYGYRSYDTLDAPASDQVVVVHELPSGRVVGLAVGSLLGPRRVGAIGAVALDVLGPLRVETLGLVGTGVQAYHQLWAMRAVRELGSVRVFSRSAERRRVELALPPQPDRPADGVDRRSRHPVRLRDRVHLLRVR